MMDDDDIDEDLDETPERFPHTTNALALEHTIEALTGLGPEHYALVEQARVLATHMDLLLVDSKIHGEYREVLKRLIEAGRPQETDAYEILIAKLTGKTA